MGVDVKDKIIIFDEAHNLEGVAEGVKSCELSMKELL